MFSNDYSTKEYQADYLQERQQAYQDAHADGEWIIEGLWNAITWIAGGLERWGITFYQSNYPVTDYLEQQNP